MKKVSVALAFAAITAFAQPSFAQGTPSTTAQVVAACEAGGDCLAIVQAFLAGRTVTTGLVANLAVGLGNLSGVAGVNNLSAAIGAVASASPDANQATQVANLASSVQSGGTFNTASIGTGASAE